MLIIQKELKAKKQKQEDVSGAMYAGDTLDHDLELIKKQLQNLKKKIFI